MMWRALETFRDLEDRHLYQAGDGFPHDGRAISKERLNVLSSRQNATGRPLIAQDEETPKAETEKPRRPRKTPKAE